jgi:hypothetical protein
MHARTHALQSSLQPEDMALLEQAVQNNFLFSFLSPEQRTIMLGLFEKQARAYGG